MKSIKTVVAGVIAGAALTAAPALALAAPAFAAPALSHGLGTVTVAKTVTSVSSVTAPLTRDSDSANCIPPECR